MQICLSNGGYAWFEPIPTYLIIMINVLGQFGVRAVIKYVYYHCC